MAKFTYNQSIVLGRIFDIPTVRYNQFGEPTAHIHVLTKIIPEDKLPYAGDPWDEPEFPEEWVFVTCEASNAEEVERMLDGGDLILCEGPLHTVSWLDGAKNYHKEVAIAAQRVEVVCKNAFEVGKAKAGIKPKVKKRK